MLVEVRVVGRKEQGLEPREIAPPASDSLALGELIAHVVRHEVAGYNDRERQRRFVRALSREEIAHGAAAGRVDPGGRETTGPADVDAAISVALEGFADGLYFVFVDDRQVEEIDAPIAVTADTRLRFVRLVPLAGGC